MLFFLPPEISLLGYLGLIGISFLMYFKVMEVQRKPIETGIEGMIGKKCRVIEEVNPKGLVKYHSEIWGTSSRRSFNVGEEVRIVGYDGLHLVVDTKKS